jgi:hypothetical protein
VPWLWSLESTYPGKYAFLTAACPLLDVEDPVNFAAAPALPPLVCSVEPYGPANQICAPLSYPNLTSLNCQIGNMTFKPFLKGLARLSPTGPGPGSLTIRSCSSTNLPLPARQQGANAIYTTEIQNTARALMHCFCGPHNLRPKMLQTTVSCLQQCGPHILIIKGLQVSRFAIEAQFSKLTLLVIASHSPLKSDPATHLENHPEEEIKQGPATAHRLESCGLRCFGQEETYTMSDAGGKRPRHTKPLSKPCDARPCLVWRLTCASFGIIRAFPSHCISTTKQPFGSDDKQFWGKTSGKGESYMGYVIVSDYIHALSIFFPPILSDRVNAAQFFTSSVEAMPSRSFNSNFLEPWPSCRILRSEVALPSVTKYSQVSQQLLRKGTTKMNSSSNGQAALFAVKPSIPYALSCTEYSICISHLQSCAGNQSDRLRVSQTAHGLRRKFQAKSVCQIKISTYLLLFFVQRSSLLAQPSTVNLWLQELWKHNSLLLPQIKAATKWLTFGMCSM